MFRPNYKICSHVGLESIHYTSNLNDISFSMIFSDFNSMFIYRFIVSLNQ